MYHLVPMSSINIIIIIFIIIIIIIMIIVSTMLPLEVVLLNHLKK